MLYGKSLGIPAILQGLVAPLARPLQTPGHTLVCHYFTRVFNPICLPL